ncbi:hypothetical protein NDU88_002424 [Pleurodeles waltl]|uniref:Uncharacterized protein n=1 Tax=Pleurodeles waltl TaxID=8319 RepID=A0AAV7SE79_PLEWA|nr:hypothetical protein NDU88_002424 [Pleurodeles waltl]
MWRRNPSRTGVLVRESCGVLTALQHFTGAGFSYSVTGVSSSAQLWCAGVFGSARKAASSTSHLLDGRRT